MSIKTSAKFSLNLLPYKSKHESRIFTQAEVVYYYKVAQRCNRQRKWLKALLTSQLKKKSKKYQPASLVV